MKTMLQTLNWHLNVFIFSKLPYVIYEVQKLIASNKMLHGKRYQVSLFNFLCGLLIKNEWFNCSNEYC